MESLNKDIFSVINFYLKRKDKLNLAIASKKIYCFFANDSHIILNYKLYWKYATNICQIVNSFEYLDNLYETVSILIVDFDKKNKFYNK